MGMGDYFASQYVENAKNRYAKMVLCGCAAIPTSTTINSNLSSQFLVVAFYTIS